ncbi:hypothetical protein ACEQPO_30995 [Bacillus sp. SL00103]
MVTLKAKRRFSSMILLDTAGTITLAFTKMLLWKMERLEVYVAVLTQYYLDQQ